MSDQPTPTLTDPALDMHAFYLKKAAHEAAPQQAARAERFLAQVQGAADGLRRWLDLPPEQVDGDWVVAPPAGRREMVRRYYSGLWQDAADERRAWLVVYALHDAYLLRLILSRPGAAHPPAVFDAMRRQLPWRPDLASPDWLGQRCFYTALSAAPPDELAHAVFGAAQLQHTALTCGVLYGLPARETPLLLICATPEQDRLAGDFFDQLAPQLSAYSCKAFRQAAEYETHLHPTAEALTHWLSETLSETRALQHRLRGGAADGDLETVRAAHERLHDLKTGILTCDDLLTTARDVLDAVQVNVENYRWVTGSNPFLADPAQDALFAAQQRRLERLPAQMQTDLRFWVSKLEKARRALEILRPVAAYPHLSSTDPQALRQRARLRQTLATRFNLGELRTLCFDLGIDYDDLPAEGKANKARELVAYLERHQRLQDLVALGQHRRPDIDWGWIDPAATL